MWVVVFVLRSVEFVGRRWLVILSGFDRKDVVGLVRFWFRMSCF